MQPAAIVIKKGNSCRTDVGVVLLRKAEVTDTREML